MESTQNKTRCPHSKKCGGCQLQNLDYKEQLAHKERTCIRLLGKFCRVEPIIGMENPYHYRNKVQAAFGTTRAGRIISGIYQSSTHNIVAVDSCMTEDEIADRIIVDIRRLLRDFKMTTYNEVTGRGFLRHVLVKRGFQTGEVMVVLVTGTPIFPARNNFTRALLKLHPEITTIIQNVNDRYTSTAPAISRIFSAGCASAFRQNHSTRSTPCRPRCCTAKRWNLRSSRAKKPSLTRTAASAPSAWSPPKKPDRSSA